MKCQSSKKGGKEFVIPVPIYIGINSSRNPDIISMNPYQGQKDSGFPPACGRQVFTGMTVCSLFK